MTDLRKIVAARRAIPTLVKEALLPMEETARTNALLASSFVTLLQRSHGDAALPHSTGVDVIRLATEAASLAAEGVARMAKIHDELLPIYAAFWSDVAPPDCPPNDGRLSSPLRMVA